ncbi:hypothetical protein KM043_009420 [Ampulex compressa]|nr:hypothetical protein KM043_009420 [Ampulex compressa]
MRVPGCGVPPPPDKRRLSKDNSTSGSTASSEDRPATATAARKAEGKKRYADRCEGSEAPRGSRRAPLRGSCAGCFGGYLEGPRGLWTPERRVAKFRPRASSAAPVSRGGRRSTVYARPASRCLASSGVTTTLRLSQISRENGQNGASRLQPGPQQTSQLLMFIPDTLRSCMVEPDVSTYLQAPSVGQEALFLAPFPRGAEKKGIATQESPGRISRDIRGASGVSLRRVPRNREGIELAARRKELSTVEAARGKR